MPPPFESQPNLIDLLVAALVLIYALSGYRQGWLVGLIELGGFVLALYVGLSFFAPAANQLVAWSPLPYSLSKPAAFLALWFATDLLYGLIVRGLLVRLAAARRRSPIDRLLGLWPGAARGVILAAILLTVSAAVPFPEPIAGTLQGSRAAQALASRTTALSEGLNQVFGDAVQDTLGLLTVKPESNERVALPFRVADAAFDPAGESHLIELVNRERTARGLRVLEPDQTLRDVARAHSTDMFRRGYFAHLDPDGQSPFDRMRAGGVRFRAAGENLALAPTIEVAHTGLMNSPGHRENILNPAFGRIGIGVADGKLHGKMITQAFAD